MYLADVSTRRVDDISQLLRGSRMPSRTLSDKLKKVYEEIDGWRNRGSARTLAHLGSRSPVVR